MCRDGTERDQGTVLEILENLEPAKRSSETEKTSKLLNIY